MDIRKVGAVVSLFVGSAYGSIVGAAVKGIIGTLDGTNVGNSDELLVKVTEG